MGTAESKDSVFTMMRLISDDDVSHCVRVLGNHVTLGFAVDGKMIGTDDYEIPCPLLGCGVTEWHQHDIAKGEAEKVQSEDQLREAVSLLKSSLQEWDDIKTELNNEGALALKNGNRAESASLYRIYDSMVEVEEGRGKPPESPPDAYHGALVRFARDCVDGFTVDVEGVPTCEDCDLALALFSAKCDTHNLYRWLQKIDSEQAVT